MSDYRFFNPSFQRPPCPAIPWNFKFFVITRIHPKNDIPMDAAVRAAGNGTGGISLSGHF